MDKLRKEHEQRELEFSNRLKELEAQNAQNNAQSELEKELERKMQAKLSEMEADFKQRELEAKKFAEQKLLEYENEKRELQILEQQRMQKRNDERIIDEKLIVVWPQVKEANTIAQEMGRPYHLSVKLHTVFDKSSGVRTSDLRIEVLVLKNLNHIYLVT